MDDSDVRWAIATRGDGTGGVNCKGDGIVAVDVGKTFGSGILHTLVHDISTCRISASVEGPFTELKSGSKGTRHNAKTHLKKSFPW